MMFHELLSFIDDSDPRDWKVNAYTMRHRCGLGFWTANGFLFAGQLDGCPGEGSLSFFQRLRVMRRLRKTREKYILNLINESHKTPKVTNFREEIGA